MSSTSNIDDEINEKWDEIHDEIKRLYEEAYIAIDEATKLDERGCTKNALPFYELGLNLINKALEKPINEPKKPDLSWEKAFAMVQKLKKSRKEVLLRIENVKSQASSSAVELPPSYEDAVAGLEPHDGSYKINKNNSNNIKINRVPTLSQNVDPYVPPSAIYDQELLANLHLSEQNSTNSVTYSDLSQQLKEMKLMKDEEILFRCENVQLYFIAPDGRVSSTSEPNTLIFARVHDATSEILDEALISIITDVSRGLSKRKKRHKHHGHHHLSSRRHWRREKKHRHGFQDESMDESKRTFLQVGSWVYPLIPEVSPCIRSDFGAFILPDITSDVEGAAIGIILPEETSEEVHELFDRLLNEITATGRSRRSVLTDSSSDKFSSKIVRGASYLAQNLVRGAGNTARFIDTSTPKLIDKISSPSEPQPINPKIQKTVEVAKTVSGKAVDVTDYLATKISMATSALGRYLSPYVQKQGTRLLTSTTNMTEEEASQKINTMLSVTSDAVESISTVYSGLDVAANILAKSLANNTVQVIEYKYGQPAGALTSDAITTIGNVYHAKHNVRRFHPKGIARAAVRGAGSAILEDYRHSTSNTKPHDEFQGSGPGDGSGFRI